MEGDIKEKVEVCGRRKILKYQVLVSDYLTNRLF